jgi:hypothetical protein
MEMTIYSNGAISYEEAINMQVDETPFIIHNYKKHYDAKEQGRQDFIKACFEYANKAVEGIIKAIVGKSK